MKVFVRSLMAVALFGGIVGVRILMSGFANGAEMAPSEASALFGGEDYEECGYDWDCEPYDLCSNSICPDCTQHNEEDDVLSGYACTEANSGTCLVVSASYYQCKVIQSCKTNTECECVIDYSIPETFVWSHWNCNDYP